MKVDELDNTIRISLYFINSTQLPTEALTILYRRPGHILKQGYRCATLHDLLPFYSRFLTCDTEISVIYLQERALLLKLKTKRLLALVEKRTRHDQELWKHHLQFSCTAMGNDNGPPLDPTVISIIANINLASISAFVQSNISDQGTSLSACQNHPT